MYKPLTKTLLTSFSALVLSCTFSFSVYAEKADLTKETHISGSRTAGDLKNKIFSYIDNVIITQGSLTIKADLAQVIRDINSNEKTYVAKGKPASFTQTLEDGTPIYLQANEIKYQPGKNLVIISGNAELRQDGSKMKGNLITYNFLTEKVSASADSNDDSDRVSTVLQSDVLDKDK